MKGATSDHSCLWCTIHKSNRLEEFVLNYNCLHTEHTMFIVSFKNMRASSWVFRFDMSKPEKYYHEKPMARTLDEIRKCALDQKMSCVHQPLIDIHLDNIIIDELHLMLRITGQFYCRLCVV